MLPPASAPHTWASGDDAITAYLQAMTDWINFHRIGYRSHLYLSAAQSHTSSGNFQAVAWDAEVDDVDNMHSPGSNRIAVAATGRYRYFGALGFVSNGTGNRALQVRKNSAGSASGGTALCSPAFVTATGGSSPTVIPFAGEDVLTAGDYFEVFGLQSSGGSLAYYTASVAGWAQQSFIVVEHCAIS